MVSMISGKKLVRQHAKVQIINLQTDVVVSVEVSLRTIRLDKYHARKAQLSSC